jgi:dinuclear metal center YbgI/SA1388 family protein
VNSPASAAWLIDAMQEFAPLHWAEGWDNVGLLIGDANQSAKKVLIALDTTQEVVEEAINGGFDFIVCHHPLIFDPLKKITAETVQGRKILALIRAGIGLYCAHTNLDKAPGGVNDALFAKLFPSEKKPECEPLIPDCNDSLGLGLVYNLPRAVSLAAFVQEIKTALNLTDIRFSGDAAQIISRVGLCGGDASNPRYWQAAKERGCNAFITGDLRHHTAQDAHEAGVALVDISHFEGEAPIIEAIANRLRTAAKAASLDVTIEATQTKGQVFYHS